MKFFTSLTMTVGAAMLLSCIDIDPDFGYQGDSSDPTDPPDQAIQCCMETDEVNVAITQTRDRYYWLGLEARDSMYKWGEPVFVPGQTIDTIRLSLQMSYLDSVAGGDYNLVVYGSDSVEHVGRKELRVVAGNAGILTVSDFAAQTCSLCCNPFPLAQRRGFAQFRKTNQLGTTLRGVRASMFSRYGRKLCGDVFDTITSFSLSLINVSHDTSVGWNGSIWSQFGFGTFRIAGQADIWKCRFMEAQGESTGTFWQNYDERIYLNSVEPSDGSSHDYSVELDQSTGRWYFYYDWSLFDSTKVLPIWRTALGSYSRLGCEILHQEDDLAGTVGSPCIIRNVEHFNISYGWIPLTIAGGDSLQSTDFTRWMVDTLPNNAIAFWDVAPRP